jgi:hypothetical protein
MTTMFTPDDRKRMLGILRHARRDLLKYSNLAVRHEDLSDRRTFTLEGYLKSISRVSRLIGEIEKGNR